MAKPRILALIPAYNESVHIANIIYRTKEILPVLVIDDGSHDRTAAIAAECGADVFRQIPNQGKGRALRRGFQTAIERNYDAVITLDADGQHTPEEIPLFIDAFEQTGSDLVIGFRQFSKMPLIRRFSNTIGTILFSWAVGCNVRDNQSGFRLISNHLMHAMLECEENSFEYEVEMIIRCLQQGMSISWVPIETIYADEKSHIRPIRHVYHFFRMVFRARKAMHTAAKEG